MITEENIDHKSLSKILGIDTKKIDRTKHNYKIDVERLILNKTVITPEMVIVLGHLYVLEELIQFLPVSMEYIEEWASTTNWRWVIKNLPSETFTPEFIRKYRDDFSFDAWVRFHNLTFEQIKKYEKDLDFNKVSSYQEMTDQLVKRYTNPLTKCGHISWIHVSKWNRTIDLDFITKYFDKFNLGNILSFHPLPEEWLDQHIQMIFDRNCLYELTKTQKLSIDFCLKHANLIKGCCGNLLYAQKFTLDELEQLYNAMPEYFKWRTAVVYQSLGDEGFNRFKKQIEESCLDEFLYYQYAPKTRKKYKSKIYGYMWQYAPNSKKLKALKKSGLYEIIDDTWVIAYKNIRVDRYSHYNFIFKYEEGKTYTSHADHDQRLDNSYGLSAWTLNRAIAYEDNGIVVKVKIHIDDIAALVHDNTKIRCTKFKVMKQVK